MCLGMPIYIIEATSKSVMTGPKSVIAGPKSVSTGPNLLLLAVRIEVRRRVIYLTSINHHFTLISKNTLCFDSVVPDREIGRFQTTGRKHVFKIQSGSRDCTYFRGGGNSNY